MRRSWPVGLGKLVSARSSSASSRGLTARHACSSHACCSVDNGAASTRGSASGLVSVAVNGGSRVVYGEELVAVYNDRFASPGLSVEAQATLRRGLAGPLVTRDEADYEAARHVWNGSIDRHPGAIIRAA